MDLWWVYGAHTSHACVLILAGGRAHSGALPFAP